MDECLLYAGTEDGIRSFILGPDLTLRPVGRGLHGNAVRAIAVHPENPKQAYVACGLRGWGLHVTTDAGQTFTTLGFPDRWVWDVAWQPGEPQTIWVGTEPPMMYRSRDGGATFQAMEQIEHLPGKNRWHFFHPPFYAGHIHGIAIHPDQPMRIFAGVEQGGLIYSHDGGQTWQEALVGKDLHRIGINRNDPNHIMAGAGEGLFVSKDAGLTWDVVEPLRGKYIHSVLCDADDSNRWYVYADEASCPLYRSDDGGKTWHCIGTGLPTAQPADNLVRHPTAPHVLMYAGDTAPHTSSLFLSTDAGESWERIMDRLPKIWRLRAIAHHQK
jgi:photosystem II stability/assembly factor-like uncharacterized protein